MLTIETINICNNACIICPYTVHTRARKTMSMAIFQKIVNEYISIGGGPLSLTPMMGEVFLDKLLPKRLLLLRASPEITTISATTNATMARRYSDTKLTEVLSAFDRILVSVYGLDRNEFNAMARRDDYELMIEQLVRLLTLSKPNTVHIAMRLLKKRPPDEITTWESDVARRAGIQNLQVHSRVTEFQNWNYFDVTQPLPHDATWAPPVTTSHQCLVPLIAFQALVDGTISFCHCADYEGNPGLGLGNVKDVSFIEILSSDKIRRLWRWDRYGIPDLCRSCNFHRPVDLVKNIPWVYNDPNRFLGG